MNALHPPVLPQVWPDASGTVRFVRRLSSLYLVIALALAMALIPEPGLPLLAEFRASGLGGVAEGAVLLALTGLLATLPLAAARAGLLPRRSPKPLDPAELLSRTARQPQAIIVPVLSLCAAACAWLLRPVAAEPASSAVLLGGGAIALTFPLLVAERLMASKSIAELPEAGALQALLLVPAAIIPLAGLLEVGSGLGIGWARLGTVLLAAYLCLVALELATRALANWFLPPPAPDAARAAVTSLAALMLQPGRVAPDGLSAPIRTHLGIDFSRSWALRYMRAAALPIGTVLLLIAWGLTGVSLIDLDQRGVYERLGAPVRVWAPGAHIGLPWPFGRVRRVDLGVIHAVLLGGEGAREAAPPAEAPSPASADRLWEGVHPSEVSYLIASPDTAGGQSFQSISVDLRALYRVGLDDASALKAAYAVVSPDALVRTEAGRLLAREFAGQVLTALLGENRETMAEALRTRLQAELDQAGSGIELLAMVVEAIHPPAGAADAYHNVQAAEIIANTAIATERGRAQATASMAKQRATGVIDGAQGTAADTVSQAKVARRTFTADQEAEAVGGEAFLMERYFATIAKALVKSPLVIVDHRLGGADAPVIDLRAFGPPPGRPGDDD